jgi:ComF family protein
MSLYTFKRSVLSIVYPNRCAFCGEVIEADEYFCGVCPLPDFCVNDSGCDSAFCCVYNSKSKPLISKAKENADGYAVSACAVLLHDALEKCKILHKIDLVVPVPPRKAAQRQRGYSFPALLAKEIAQLAGKQFSRKTLLLLRETDEQKDLSAAGREENLRGAFGVGKPPHGRNVLVIDDVSTTGATLNEARRVLAECAGEVYAAAFAKTM